MRSLWNNQLKSFLQHLTSTGNNGASYFFIDVHVSADTSTSLDSAAKAKHQGYKDAWTRFQRNASNDDDFMTFYKQLNHSRNGRPEVLTFGVNYDGYLDKHALGLMSRLAAIKYPEDSTNRSYQVSRQRWISHYVRQIQLAIANGAAPAISLTIRNLTGSARQ